jgi:hypothetical protein
LSPSMSNSKYEQLLILSNSKYEQLLILMGIDASTLDLRMGASTLDLRMGASTLYCSHLKLGITLLYYS